MCPAALQGSLFPHRACLQLAAPTGPTCVTRFSQSVTDNGLVSEGLGLILEKVDICKKADIKTHRPVVFTFLPRPVAYSLQKLRIPKELPKCYLPGP